MELLQQPTQHSSVLGKRNDEVNVVQLIDNDIESDPPSTVSNSLDSTNDDIKGMRRMGKEQQFERRFRQLSIISFVSIATASWEIGLFIISPALIDGGRAGLVWSSLWCWIGFAPIYLSMVRGAVCFPQERLCLVDVVRATGALFMQSETASHQIRRQRWPAWLLLPAPNTIGFPSSAQRSIRSS